MSATINDNTLTIQLNSKQKNALNTGPLPTLNVHVPIKDYETLEISNEFGRISLESKSGLYPRNLVVSGSAVQATLPPPMLLEQRAASSIRNLARSHMICRRS